MNSVIFKKAKLFRNVKDFKFSNKLTNEQKDEILNIVSKALGKDFTLLQIKSLDANMLNYLKENSFINQHSTTIFLSKKDSVCIDLFNIEHITVVATTNQNEDIFAKISSFSKLLSDKINLAYSDEFGYLMSDLTKIGAGIQLETDICLDAICGLNKIEQVKQNIKKLGYLLKETNIKTIYRMQTECNLGFSEKEIVTEFDNTLSKLQDLEIESAKMLDVSNHDDIYDKIVRSNAILNSAHLINYEELTTILIILRTGINLGYVDISLKTLNEIQKLVLNKNLGIISKSQCKELAEQIKTILKGEKNV